MSHPEIIENCKRITVKHLLDAIGSANIVSIILYGSVARNEESYNYKDGKLYLESDIDVVVVVKNRILVIKSWLFLKDLCSIISDELKKNWLLSHVNLSVTTEKRLLFASPNAFDLHLKLNGKVIFGKELIALMPRYGHLEYKNIPVRYLCNMILYNMITLVRSLASSDIIEGKVDVSAYESILRAIRKLTLFMVRAIILKEGIPLNPYSLPEIKTKRRLYEIKTSAVFDDLLKSYDDIVLTNHGENFSVAEVERCLDRVIIQLKSTLAILTDTKNPFVTLPKNLVFGNVPLTEKLTYGFQYGMYLLVTNFRTGWSIGLFKYVIYITFRREDITSKFYDLFISSSSLIKSLNDEGITNNQRRQAWMKLYKNTLKPWKYGTVTGA